MFDSEISLDPVRGTNMSKFSYEGATFGHILLAMCMALGLHWGTMYYTDVLCVTGSMYLQCRSVIFFFVRVLFSQNWVYLQTWFWTDCEIRQCFTWFYMWWYELHPSLVLGLFLHMKHMYLQGMFIIQNKILSIFQHLSSILRHLGATCQTAWGTFHICRDFWCLQMERKQGGFCRFARIWRTNEEETARRDGEDIKGGEQQRHYWRTEEWVTGRSICGITCRFGLCLS